MMLASTIVPVFNMPGDARCALRLQQVTKFSLGARVTRFSDWQTMQEKGAAEWIAKGIGLASCSEQ